MAKTTPFRFVNENPTHELSLRQIDAWLEECNQSHRKCSQCSPVAVEQTRLPTRVLDLSGLPAREVMNNQRDWHSLFQYRRLRLVEHLPQKHGQFVALSYCWGTTSTYKTTTENRKTHLQGIRYADLPKTLQDAIILTRYLGLRYIWIDCLCIVQASNGSYFQNVITNGI